MSDDLNHIIVTKLALLDDDNQPSNGRKVLLFRSQGGQDMPQKEYDVTEAMGAIFDLLTADVDPEVTRALGSLAEGDNADTLVSVARLCRAAKLDNDGAVALFKALGFELPTTEKEVRVEVPAEESAEQKLARSMGLILDANGELDLSKVERSQHSALSALWTRTKENEERITRMEEDKRTGEIQRAVSSIPDVPGEDAVIVEILRHADGKKGLYDKAMTFLRGIDAVIKRSALFGEVGSGAGGSDPNSAAAIIRSRAEALVTADPKMTYGEAERRILEQDEALYLRYEKERLASARRAEDMQ